MTREQLQRLVDGALCIIDKCEEDECAKFATWQAWEFGNIAGGQPWCDEHCPPCTELRGGYCRQGADGHLLAQELNDLMATPAGLRRQGGDVTQLASGKQLVCETCGAHSPDWGGCAAKGLGAGRGHDWVPIPECMSCEDTAPLETVSCPSAPKSSAA